MRQLEEMATFAVLVEEGSFTRAAARLKRSKAYVSQQLSRLEDSLGVQLLFRTTRRLELTEAGRSCLPDCQKALEASADIRRTVANLGQDMRGNLRITVPVSFGEAVFRQLVFDFTALYPDITIELEMENGQRDLVAGGYDLAVRATQTPQDDLVALHVGNLVEVICASPEYLKAAPPLETAEDLSAHRCILNRYQASAPIWSMARGGETLDVPISGAFTLNHYPSARAAALDGHGLARLPSYLVRHDLEAGRLKAVLTDHHLPTVPIYLVYPYQGKLPLRTRKMVDFAKARLLDLLGT